MIPPLLFLAALLVVTAVAAMVATLVRRSRSARIAALAHEWQMRFTPGDRFQLTPKVAAQLPQPGAADVFLKDLVYDQEAAGSIRYLFTVEYTLGVLRTKRRRVSVGTLVEGAGRTAPEPFSGVTLAPADLPLPQQYEWLHQRRGGQGADNEQRQNPPADAVA